MRDRIVHYAHRLESLSITELSRRAEKLVSRERRYTAALIAHLAEISRRKGHLELGFNRALAQTQMDPAILKETLEPELVVSLPSRELRQVRDERRGVSPLARDELLRTL